MENIKIEYNKTYSNMAIQTDPTESHIANKSLNETFKTHNSIKENLDKYLQVQIKLNKSKNRSVENYQ